MTNRPNLSFAAPLTLWLAQTLATSEVGSGDMSSGALDNDMSSGALGVEVGAADSSSFVAANVYSTIAIVAVVCLGSLLLGRLLSNTFSCAVTVEEVIQPGAPEAAAKVLPPAGKGKQTAAPAAALTGPAPSAQP